MNRPTVAKATAGSPTCPTDRTAAVCPVAEPAPHYVVSRAVHVRSILRDDRTWSSRFGPGLAVTQAKGGVLVASDHPVHTAQRALLAPAFRAATTTDLGDLVHPLAHHLVTRLAPAGRGDVMTDVAVPLAMTLACRQLGLPEDRIAEYWHWVKALAESLMYPNGPLDPRVVDAYRAFHVHVNAHLSRRRADLDAGVPVPPDLLTHLMTADRDGVPLGRPELLSFCQFLLVAGSSTTALLIGNVIHRLLEHPGQFAAVRANRSLVANAVEESLRFDAPLRGLFRTSTRPARIDDVDMAAGAKVLPSLAAANRDPALWDDADTFDITRALPALRRHYAFGHGAHYCLGAPLARLEATAALSAILDHLPGLRPDGVPQRISADILSGFDRLPVAWVIAGTV